MFVLIAVSWIAIICLSLGWNRHQVTESAIMFAESEASASHNKDLVYRKWSAIQGGVYVPPTDATPANPYLSHLPDRDVTTTGGKQLTLVNPAYMTSQVHALGKEQYGIQGHITSLKLLNPNNAADPWESAALQLFEGGTEEVVSQETIDGQPYLRLMRPLITEKPCLKCHSEQGYVEGEVRGGISVSIPFSPYAVAAQQHRRQLLYAHLLIGTLGLLGLWKSNALLRSSEARLSKSEEHHKSILQAAIDGFMLIDLQGCLMEVNHSYCQMSGYSMQELLAMNIADLEAVEGADSIVSRMQNILEWGENRFESNHRRKDGSIFDIEISAQYKPGGDGHLIIFLRDITGRKQMEEQLRESEANYRFILDNMQESLSVIDGDGTFLFANDKVAANLTGNRLEVIIGNNIRQLLPVDQAEKLVEKYRQTIKSGRRAEQEVKISLDNDEKWFYNTLHPVIFGQHNTSAVISMSLDITQRKQAEKERNTLQEQLIQAQKMEAIGTLAGGIAHDFNNILGAIIGYAEMARDDCPADSTIANDIDQILKAGTRAGELVKQILAFSRQAKTDPVPLQPAAIINEVIKLLRATLPATIAIKEDIASDTWFIQADPTQIHQILMNLCTNAYHAMEEKGGTLTISLKNKMLGLKDLNPESSMQPGNFVQLSIEDTGVGIKPNIREKIFDPYFTTKEIGKGTGMGLATVHGIVQSYGGSIMCDSHPGQGTIFLISLPSVPALSAKGKEPAEQHANGREHILLIDDEDILVEVGKAMLQRLGYKVTTRSNSIEALATFQDQPDAFDLIITDLTMPGMTGVDLSRRMLQIRPDLPVILCTGYSSLLSEEKAKAMGIRGFAMKPFSKKEISQLIRRVLKGEAQ